MKADFIKKILEHYDKLPLITEETNRTNAAGVIPDSYNKVVIERAIADMIADQLVETGTMGGPVEKIPVESYSKDGGATTAEVNEGGQIVKATTQFSSTVLTAVAFKLQSILTAEVIEDAKNAGNMDVVARALKNIAGDIANEIDTKIFSVLVTGAAAGNVDWSKASTDRKTLVEKIVDAITLVKNQKHRPEFMAANPEVVAYFLKLEEFTHADKYGSDIANQKGFVGKIRGLEVFESPNMVTDKILIGKKKTCGCYRIYVPTMFRGPVYDPNTDKEIYVARQRSAVKALVGEALATVTLIP